MDDDVAEEGAALRRGIALGLAELSAVEQSPLGFDHGQPQAFAAEEVHFDDFNGWFPPVVQVQEWLRLLAPIPRGAARPHQVAALFAGMGVEEPTTCFVAPRPEDVRLSDEGLDRLGHRVDRAVALMTEFREHLLESSPRLATTRWEDAWEDVVSESVAGPIKAKTDVWPIQNFVSQAKRGRLDISPSYQRGDAWLTGDAQLLIESILRGIPLPSIILLRPHAGRNSANEVVDGKQRLTSILRFVGAHPRAVERVTDADSAHPGLGLARLFLTDYRQFRTSWQSATGEVLSSHKEREYYFPFKVKLSQTVKKGDPRLAPLDGKYYYEISDDILDQLTGSTVGDLFESAGEYKIPVIEYVDATPQQVHQVFALYNKQGKHLNAEELRNAAYHDVLALRALAVLAGDDTNVEAVPGLASAPGMLERVATVLDAQGVPQARYRRTKLLSWVSSLIVADCLSADDVVVVRSTAQHINDVLEAAQKGESLLHRPSVVRELVSLLVASLEGHLAVAWPDAFKGGKNWQDLPLVASLVGVALGCATVGEVELRRRLQASSGDIVETSAAVWQRPAKTQTKNQWQYIATVALGLLEALDIDPDAADVAMSEIFGASPVRAFGQLAGETAVGVRGGRAQHTR